MDAPRLRSFVVPIAAGLAASLAWPALAQREQQPSARTDWPCGGRVDPSYFQVAEATGGHLLLLAPFELGDAASVLIPLTNHPHTLLRVAGVINPGQHEFTVPVDSTVESLAFSIAVQCLQEASVIGPTGEPVGGPGITDLSNFRAMRLVVVERPATGTWTIRVAGSGVTGIAVQARSSIALSAVEFASAEAGTFGPLPVAGVENVVRITVSGASGVTAASVVNAGFRDIAPLRLEPLADRASTLAGRYRPAGTPFRVRISGTDAAGLPFQRVWAPLLTAQPR